MSAQIFERIFFIAIVLPGKLILFPLTCEGDVLLAQWCRKIEFKFSKDGQTYTFKFQ